MSTYPRVTETGQTVWACCESRIGPGCQHLAQPKDECATPGCERTARWISVWAPPRRRPPYRRHCVPCCDQISHLMNLLREIGETS